MDEGEDGEVTRSRERARSRLSPIMSATTAPITSAPPSIARGTGTSAKATQIHNIGAVNLGKTCSVGGVELGSSERPLDGAVDPKLCGLGDQRQQHAEQPAQPAADGERGGRAAGGRHARGVYEFQVDRRERRIDAEEPEDTGERLLGIGAQVVVEQHVELLPREPVEVWA